MSTQATKTIVVTEATHEAIGRFRELLEATNGTPYSHGDAVAVAMRRAVRGPHVLVSAIMAVAGALVPAISEARFKGINVDPPGQHVTIRFHDRDAVVVPVALPTE